MPLVPPKQFSQIGKPSVTGKTLETIPQIDWEHSLAIGRPHPATYEANVHVLCPVRQCYQLQTTARALTIWQVRKQALLYAANPEGVTSA